MQRDGGYQSWGSITDIPDGAGFIMAPFTAQGGDILSIVAERDELPDTMAWDLLSDGPSVSNAVETSREAYEKNFAHYHAALHDENSGIEKLVLTRQLHVPLPADFSPAHAYQRACERSPHAFNALVHSPLTGTWLTSTPELLLGGAAPTWQCISLAGTQKRGGQWSLKNREEQAYVSRHLRELFTLHQLPFQEGQTGNYVVGDIEHLCTSFDLQVPREGLLSLLQELSPTPAVAGYPRDAALRFMQENPDTEREYYTGYLGVYDPSGLSTLHVCIRCMKILPTHAQLYAGGGIMPDSRLEEEWEESRLKLMTMQSLLG